MTVTLLALTAGGVAPATATAGSLLSGYGGPGQGNQAIIGSALVGGPSGGGGSGGSTGTGSTVGGGEAAGGLLGAGSSGRSSSRKSTRGSQRTKGKHRGSDVKSAQPVAAASGAIPPAHGSAGVATPALGISAADLLYILLAAGALALTAGVTRQLTRQPG
ncbi:MAG TPA: hypothetical protein VH025_07005 [Solirubrobacteraceae bacterium]|jgi:hypothetical protein|nr:hypothetical protein [Solirubrobacteraceae bacterium]